MSDNLVVRGRYADHTFIPEGQLPDAEGPAELIISPSHPKVAISIFDLFGKATNFRTAEQIAIQIREERNEWGEP
jgi:hypothetical protein